jgi:hypothetical protein
MIKRRTIIINKKQKQDHLLDHQIWKEVFIIEEEIELVLIKIIIIII